MLRSKTTPIKRKHNFLFSGMIRCAECGGLYTWEIHRGHTYGHCNYYRECKQRGWVREEEFDSQVLQALNDLQINNQYVRNWLRIALKQSHKDEVEYHANTMNELQAREKSIKQRMDKLYDDKLDEKITEDFYDRKFKQYSTELDEVVNSIKKHSQASSNYLSESIELYNMSQRVKDDYVKAKELNLIDDLRIVLRKTFGEIIALKGKITYKYTPALTALHEAVIKTNGSKITKTKILKADILEHEKNFEDSAQYAFLELHRPSLLPR